MVKPSAPGTPLDVRIKRLVSIDENGCWNWIGSVNRAGYGRITIGPRVVDAHRAAYKVFVGDVPAGLTLDHLCRRPICCSPAHLEPVTQRENNRRGNGISTVYARRDRCKNGHLFVPGSYRLDGTVRRCRACSRAWTKKYLAKKKEAASRP